MGWPDVLRLLACILGSGVLVAAAGFALRRLGVLSRLPRRAVPVVATAAMMLGTTVGLVGLYAGPPSSARAATSTPEAVVPPAGARSFRAIRVYELESWGERARRRDVGTTISRTILAGLRQRGLNAKPGRETDLPVGLHEMIGARPTDLIAHYSKIAPFVCVSGHVSSLEDGRFELVLIASHIDRAVRSTTLLQRTVTFSESEESVDQAATQATEELVAVVED